ncbi:hypothetical protein QTH90_20905 [Variovorax sp. J2P1-59]|uniref:hypothetical protein n=1 Tax=Variovorax flavidus TaxID=3053501 RepID=UPI0025776CD5|nr:hypothetical protein [Variovorax sp. J2P1-59]MDM0076881.1 hypothetical protein [Variovorax sp. J2P1-59]
MSASVKNDLRHSLQSNKRQLEKRLDAADGANGRIPGQASSKVTVCVSFSLLPTEVSLIRELQARAAREGRVTWNSEIARAGLLLLSALSGPDLVAALDKVERVKPGRKKETR